MRKIFKNLKQKVITTIFGVATMTGMMVTNVYATVDTSAVTKPLDILKVIVIAIVTSIGGIVLVKNIMEFATAYQQQDTSSMNSALKGIVGGLMMAGVSVILGILGFS